MPRNHPRGRTRTLMAAGLYALTLSFVSREWDAGYPRESEEAPNFTCWSCDSTIVVPSSGNTFQCPDCGEQHRLSDYLSIGHDNPDERSREDAATALRDVMETLTLFQFVRIYLHQPEILTKILFVKDGPLLLRAALSRLVEPIRSLIGHLKAAGTPLHIVGVEKNGDLVRHIAEFKSQLPRSQAIPSFRQSVTS